ncbi:MAG: hypothetical protein AB1921_12725 [Thermodesulfobacteriota bacterium]
MARYGKIWPMTRPSPFGNIEMHKCTECGGESFPENGWSGSPEEHACGPHCSCRSNPAVAGSSRYRDNFARIFPKSPGANV